MANRPTIRNAFTLIELLVVISILAILTALIIPRLRVVNKERGIREAARVVSSAFAQASQRGLIDGVSGVLLRRNPNFRDASGYSFVVDSTSILRAVPNFHGDQLTDTAITASGDAVTIPYPIEQPALEIIRAGDEISFGNNSLRYTIATVTPMPAGGPPFTSLTLGLVRTGTSASYLPDPSLVLAIAKPYTIHRLPRPLRSSETQLPNGFSVDLRFTGFSTSDSGFEAFPNNSMRSTSPPQFPTQVFEPHPRITVTLSSGSTEVVDFAQSDVALLFNNDGGLDRMVLLAKDSEERTRLFERDLVDNLQILVAELATDPNVAIDAAQNPINNPDNLWVSVSRASGSTNVGYNVIPTIGQTLTALDTQYNGTATDRTLFNAAVTGARGDSEISVAAQ